MGRDFRTYGEALREVGRLIAIGQLPARSPVVAVYLTPIKTVQTVRLQEWGLDDQDDLEAAS
jgi:hypothetical protein